MPGPIRVIAPGVVRFSFEGFIHGARPWASTCDAHLDEGILDRTEQLEDMVNNITSLFQEHVIAKLCNSVTFNGASWLDLDSMDGSSGFVTPRPGKPTGGALTDPSTPPNTAFLCRKNCSHNRAQKSGRMFLPGISEVQIDGLGSLAASAQRGTLETGLNTFRSGVSDLSDAINPLIGLRVTHIQTYTGVSEPGWPQGPPATWSSSDIDTFTVDQRAATQRRRMRD